MPGNGQHPQLILFFFFNFLGDFAMTCSCSTQQLDLCDKSCNEGRSSYGKKLSAERAIKAERRDTSPIPGTNQHVLIICKWSAVTRLESPWNNSLLIKRQQQQKLSCRFGQYTFTQLQIAVATLVRQRLILRPAPCDQYAYRGGVIANCQHRGQWKWTVMPFHGQKDVIGPGADEIHSTRHNLYTALFP